MERLFTLVYTVEFSDGSTTSYTHDDIVGAIYLYGKITVFYPVTETIGSTSWDIQGKLLDFSLTFSEDFVSLTDL